MGPKKTKKIVDKDKTKQKQGEIVIEELYKTTSRYTYESSESTTDKENSLSSSRDDERKRSDNWKKREKRKRDDRRNRDDEDYLKGIDSETVIQTVTYKNSVEKRIASEILCPTSETNFVNSLATTPVESLVETIKSDCKFHLEEEEEDNYDYEEEEISDEELVEGEEEEEEKEEEEVEAQEDEGGLVESDEPEIKVMLDTFSNERMIMYFTLDKRQQDVKESLGKIFDVNSETIKLTIKGKEYGDGLRLSELAESSSAIKFDISSSKPKEYLSPGQFQRYEKHKKHQLVKVQKDDGSYKEINVEIVNQCFFKDWLGGYMNKKTNKEYHNQMTQTLPRTRRPDQPKIYTRETQTPVFPLIDFATETSKNKSTQMSCSGVYVPNMTDKIIIGDPDRYKTVESYKSLSTMVMNITIIRAFFKKLRILLEKLKVQQDIQMRKENEEKAKLAIREALIAANRREIIGTTFPSDRENFYMLYLMIGKWWNKEMKTIANAKRNEARKAAVYDLLIKEIQFLCVIDRERNQAKKEILAKQEITFLETTARPIIFRNVQGQMSSLDNVETQQAREYHEILSSFLRKDVKKEQRIDILQNLKKLISTFGYYEYSKEIMDLIDRECELLVIGMTGKHLTGLRARILQLIQFYLHKHDINPRSMKYEKPRAAKTVKTLYMCNSCKQLKPANDFNVHVRMAKFDICHSCEWMNNIACKRQNLSPYARLLQQVRESEMKQCSASSVCYVLQPVGMTYLVSKIWEDQSVISESKRLDELRMIRFRKNEDWAPWNCILLTLDESAAHDQISNVDEFYDEWLLRKIYYKHLRAKNVFLPLILNDLQMCQSGLWYDVTDADKFLHPSHIQKFATSGDFTFFQT